MDSDWLTASEAADLLHVPAHSLRRWADQGLVRSYRTPGGHRRFKAADLDGVDLYALQETEVITPDGAA